MKEISTLDLTHVCQSLKERNSFTPEDLFLAESIKTQVKEKLLSGNYPDDSIFFIYHLFNSSSILLEEDPFFEKQIRFLEENRTLFSTFEEKVYFFKLLFILDILRQKPKEGFKKFIHNSMTIFEHTKANEYFFTFVQEELLPFLEIETSHFMDVIVDVLEEENFFKKSLADQRVTYNVLLHVFYNTKQLYGSEQNRRLYAPLKRHLIRFMKSNQLDYVPYVQFLIYHFMGNLFQKQEEWREYNQEINRLTDTHYHTWTSNHLPNTPSSYSHTKKRIGFLKDRIVVNSSYKVEKRLFTYLMKSEAFLEKYELYVYNCDYIEKDFSNEKEIETLKQMGVIVKEPLKSFQSQGYFSNHLEKALTMRNSIINDEIDTLITSMNGYGIGNFLLSARCAPKQIFWSQGDFEYDVAGIDKKITHMDIKSDHYRYFFFNLPIDLTLYSPLIENIHVEKEREKYPLNAFILGTIGRLVKLNDDTYLKTVADIMERNPHTIYIACGPGDNKEIIEKLKALGVYERFYFPGMVNANVYGHIIDLWLDTFPLEQGESMTEYLAKGNAMVSMRKTDHCMCDEDALKSLKEKNNLVVFIENIEQLNEKVEGYEWLLHTPFLLLQSNGQSFPPALDPYVYDVAFDIPTLSACADVTLHVKENALKIKKRCIQKKKLMLPPFYWKESKRRDFWLTYPDIMMYEEENVFSFSEAYSTHEYSEAADRIIRDEKLYKAQKKAFAFYYEKFNEINVEYEFLEVIE